MGFLHISPDEHLKRVMGNPSDLILKQRELSEATYPLLVSYLVWLRRLNAIQNKNDVIRQNEQLFDEFVYLCEHNLLFFLTVSGRFDIIRELFKDKDLLAKEVALLEEIEKEHAQATAANLQNFVFIPRKKESSTLLSEVPKPLPLPTSEWEKSLYGITNMSLYQYYEEEMKRITYIHHIKQIKLVDTSYEEHISLMQKAVNLISQDENISGETKQKAITLYNKLIAIKNELEAEYPDVSLVDAASSEIEAIEKQYQVKQEKLKEAQEALQSFFEEVRHEAPQLQTIYEEHQEIVRNFEKESQAIQIEWKKEMEMLSTHYENARVDALKDIDSSLSLIIDELKKCPVDELNEEQINTLDATLIQLQEYKEKLKTVEGYESTQVLLSACNKDLDTIVSIIRPALSEEAKKRFDLNVNLMKDMFAAPQDSAKHLISTPDNSLQETIDRGAESFKPNVTVPLPVEQVVDLKSSTSTIEHEKIEESQPEGKKLKTVHLPEEQVQVVDVKSSTPTIEHEKIEESQPEGEKLKTDHLPEELVQVVDVKSSTSTIELVAIEQHQSEVSEGEKTETIQLPERNSETESSKPIEVTSTKWHESEDPKKSEHVERYRFFMNSIRDGTELIEFDPEKQRNYESALKELSNVLSDLHAEVEPEISEKIKKIEILINAAKSMGFDKASPSHIQKICNACDLGIDYEPLSLVKDNLASMFHFPSSQQNNVGM
ncbi:hypothetical protein LEAN103870_10395 [Legionella anisa]|uniref:Uncharacterized protein n=2 Tax=Legionella anisa TaxID=28082 RepID=A0AAX0WZA7_9GAMM|nr:hypothetical protein DLD14_07140 [Legionella anisa]KTC75742.1 hypothetical protein Lani_0565 [Legionella anisa]MBN5935620.1 hypothetical protein [Legionella anisa]PNL63555.1 hypothetical protein A6J39_015265 [Legionella anisa]UAK81364.1 hypothetical protein K8O89_14205 [Legionella anisa]